jgi:hypothetical protein
MERARAEERVEPRRVVEGVMEMEVKPFRYINKTPLA